MWNNFKNPFVILIFSFVGMSIRYVMFFWISKIKGSKPKNFVAFSEGAKQIIYNLLVTMMTIVIFVFTLIYNLIKPGS